MASFTNIDELIRVLAREKLLLKHMFANRKGVNVRYDAVRELVEYKQERIQYLIEYGVLHESGEFLEMEDVYLQFFEQVLDVSEQISVASVRESIDALNYAIEYYQMESSDQRKYEYLRQIRRMLRNIALTTFRNVIDLKRNIDNTYKNEPNYRIKKEKLIRLDEKRRGIAELIVQTENLIDDAQAGFFRIAMDVGLNTTVRDVKLQLSDAYHNLIELDRQIIDYLNLIEYQSRLLEKLRRVKYLRDQLVLESHSNVNQVLDTKSPVWMENRPKYTLKLSLDFLRNTDEGLEALRNLTHRINMGSVARKRKADPLSAEFLDQHEQVLDMVNTQEVKNAFLASGEHLYAFIQNYNFHKPLPREEKLVLFCQIASQYLPEIVVSDQVAVDADVEYPLIFPA